MIALIFETYILKGQSHQNQQEQKKPNIWLLIAIEFIINQLKKLEFIFDNNYNILF